MTLETGWRKTRRISALPDGQVPLHPVNKSTYASTTTVRGHPGHTACLRTRGILTDEVDKLYDNLVLQKMSDPTAQQAFSGFPTREKRRIPHNPKNNRRQVFSRMIIIDALTLKCQRGRMKRDTKGVRTRGRSESDDRIPVLIPHRGPRL